ncbi:MAG: tetratricopeptide repeat protein [Salinivirgaceae bacterium]|nr:tetratricopeptide repeat protein [Salinivirgaceae bacterium]MDD4746818.1 tetratricopeptide repeat protein [Salinivirgaceae bacterium]MDY0278978.1 tetratricopeptide repeat protein [Salinivirgaceae bacterium]
MKKLLLFAIVVGIITSCSQKQPNKSIKEKIATMENIVDSVRKTRTLSPDEMYKLINLYWNYYDENPTDSISATYLYRAAESSLYINQGIKAISYLTCIESEFPTFQNMGNVIFLIGFTYENNMQDYTKAKQYYELFIEKYPDHPLVKDTHILIRNLGKTPEELVKEFETANAKKK